MGPGTKLWGGLAGGEGKKNFGFGLENGRGRPFSARGGGARLQFVFFFFKTAGNWGNGAEREFFPGGLVFFFFVLSSEKNPRSPTPNQPGKPAFFHRKRGASKNVKKNAPPNRSPNWRSVLY